MGAIGISPLLSVRGSGLAVKPIIVLSHVCLARWIRRRLFLISCCEVSITCFTLPQVSLLCAMRWRDCEIAFLHMALSALAIQAGVHASLVIAMGTIISQPSAPDGFR